MLLKVLNKTLLFLALILNLDLAVIVDAARFRFSSSRSTGSYRSYRATRTTYRSTRTYRSYRSTRFGTYGAAFAAGYMVHGMTRYRSRYYGSSYYREDPYICTNLDRYVTFENGTVSRTQKLDYFVCPYNNNDTAEDIYCCGPALKQKCCSYWNSSKKTGAIAGIVIGSVIAIGIAIFCCCKCCKRRSHAVPPPTAQYQPAKTDPVLLGNNGAQAGYYPNPGVPYPGASAPPYGTQYPPNPDFQYPAQPAPPADPNAIGFEGTGAPPPTYTSAVGVGYPTK